MLEMKRFAFSIFLVLTGCGNVVISEDGAGGAGSSGTTGKSSSTSATPTGAGGACAAFADQAGPGHVTVRFRNDSGQPIYLPANCSEPEFQITPFGGDASVDYHYDKSCLQTCQDLQTEPKYE